ncbi:hypothetical protein HY628_00220, partial [Candidatus Uhrbacteria bacterium]|nr:hypothetical protein [Candidatus Uhrbacteria bacterium]
LEATPGNLLTDPAASLAHEEALAELTNAFRDNELSKRIEALTAKGDG